MNSTNQCMDKIDEKILMVQKIINLSDEMRYKNIKDYKFSFDIFDFTLCASQTRVTLTCYNNNNHFDVVDFDCDIKEMDLLNGWFPSGIVTLNRNVKSNNKNEFSFTYNEDFFESDNYLDSFMNTGNLIPEEVYFQESLIRNDLDSYENIKRYYNALKQFKSKYNDLSYFIHIPETFNLENINDLCNIVIAVGGEQK